MIYIDPRAGSAALKQHIPKPLLGENSNIPSDIEFVGDGPDGPTIIGIEYKSLSDCLTSMTDGRLTGTQLPRMMECYQGGRIYLVIEGITRVSDEGILETFQYNPYEHEYSWFPARGRKGEGWTAAEYWGRLESVTEFFGCRVYESSNIKTTARWLVNKYFYWSKDYTSHKSYRQWDQSRDGDRPGNLLLPASGKLPLVERMARELYNVGQEKAKVVARHFKTPAEMLLADEREWMSIKWDEKLKSKPGYRRRGFSKEMAQVIRRQIWEGIDP